MNVFAVRARLAALAVGYGAVSGALAQLTLQGMTALQHLVWAGATSWWRTALTILVGGALLILLTRVAEPLGMRQLLEQDSGDRSRRQRIIVVTALSAIVAVAFGGAVGPEAGLLAVVAELSVLVGHRIAKDLEEERFLVGLGTSGALSGLYASPPGAAAAPYDAIGSAKALPILAGIAGFFAFMLCSRLIFGGVGVSAVVLPDGEVGWGVLLPAAVGAALGLAFLWLHHALSVRTAAMRRPLLVMAVGTAVFAALAAAIPLIRFSGHHEMADVVAAGQDDAGGQLWIVAGAKVLALVLCLVAGWRGGEFFPLAFAGAAGGAAVASLVGLDVGPAMAAGMAAAVVVGWGKPVAAFLVLVLLVSGSPLLATVIGIGLGWAVMSLLPRPLAESDAATQRDIPPAA